MKGQHVPRAKLTGTWVSLCDREKWPSPEVCRFVNFALPKKSESPVLTLFLSVELVWERGKLLSNHAMKLSTNIQNEPSWLENV